MSTESETETSWDNYRDDYPFREHRQPEVHMIRHGITGTPLCIFDDYEKVEAWLDDFEDEASNFDVVTFPGRMPMFVLERGGQMLPITEAQLNRGCYQL